MTKYLFDLPPGFDDRTVMTLLFGNKIGISHPDRLPHVFNEQTGVFEPITAGPPAPPET